MVKEQKFPLSGSGMFYFVFFNTGQTESKIVKLERTSFNYPIKESTISGTIKLVVKSTKLFLKLAKWFMEQWNYSLN